MKNYSTDLIYLRPISINDTDFIIKLRNSDSVRPYFIYQELFTQETHLKWLENEIYTLNAFQFIICLKENQQPIGTTYLRNFDRNHMKIEYGIFMQGGAIRKHGIGTEALKLTCQFAFENLKIHKVFGRVLSENEASKRCFLKAGFSQCGYFKDDVYINGEYKDVCFYELVNKR